MDNETTSVDSAAACSSPATTPTHSEQQNTASGTRVQVSTLAMSAGMCERHYVKDLAG